MNLFLERMSPSLTPFIGTRYGSGLTKRLFLFGESHYFPEKSTRHLDAETWYTLSHADLDTRTNEAGYIDTKGVLEEAISPGFNKSYTIYYRLAEALNQLGLNFKNSREALNHIGFANFFQRPAEEKGKSIHVKPIDSRMATEIALQHVHENKPDLLVFVSKKAWDFSSEFRSMVTFPILHVPHPACAWWYRKSSKYEGTGKDIFQKFLRDARWLSVEPSALPDSLVRSGAP